MVKYSHNIEPSIIKPERPESITNAPVMLYDVVTKLMMASVQYRYRCVT
jgi:tyrosine-protein phosphatase YwqE